MAFASPDDVAARLGRQFRNSAEEDFAATLLDDVEAQIVGRIPDLAERVAATPPTVDIRTVRRLEAWAVVRYLRNPDGKVQESIDDYSFTRDRSVSGGLLGLTDEEWDDLLPSTGTSSAFTIQSVPTPAVPPYGPLGRWL